MSGVWWRSDALKEREQRLLDAVLAAHGASVARENISTMAVLNGHRGSGDAMKALAMGILSTGGVHAPVRRIVGFLGSAAGTKAKDLLQFKKTVPGWGNEFVQDGPDPLWAAVEAVLHQEWGPQWEVLQVVTEVVQTFGLKLWPNAGAYTAAAALAVARRAPLNVIGLVAEWMFVRGRMDAWFELMAKSAVNAKE